MLEQHEIEWLTEIRDLLNKYECNPTATVGIAVLRELKVKEYSYAHALDRIIENQKWELPTPTNIDIEHAEKYRQILAITMSDCQPRG
jgi:hypothetical protein